MKPALILIASLSTIALTGCEENRYPISEQVCGPDDRVLTLQAHDCEVPGL